MIAINLEAKYTKDEILEGYLNSIYFDHGIYGIEDACRFYFNKPAKDVTLAEAATLAAIPKGPVHYSPINNPENNQKRRFLILDEMYEDGKITELENYSAKQKTLEFYGKLDRIEDENALIPGPRHEKSYGKLKIFDHYDNVKVYTGLDLNFNKNRPRSNQRPLPRRFRNWKSRSMPWIRKLGRSCCIGGRDYNSSAYNRATMALRQPGSAIKPFLIMPLWSTVFAGDDLQKHENKFLRQRASLRPDQFQRHLSEWTCPWPMRLRFPTISMP